MVAKSMLTMKVWELISIVSDRKVPRARVTFSRSMKPPTHETSLTNAERMNRNMVPIMTILMLPKSRQFYF